MRVLATLLLATTLSGCATIKSGITDVGTGFNDVVSAIDAPATQQAIVSIKTVTTAFVCDVSSAANLTVTLATQLNKAAISNNGKLVAVTAATVCSALGGALTGNTTTAGPAIAAVSKLQ